MSRFVTTPSTERIDLGEGDWVEIRTRLRFGDRRAVQEKLVGGLRRGPDGQLAEDASLHLAEANYELLLRSLAAWGGPGFCTEPEHPHSGDCTALPITRESIEALDETGERILEEIPKRQKRRTEGPGPVSFPSGPTSSTTEVAPTPAPPSGSDSSSSRSSSAPDGPGTSS